MILGIPSVSDCRHGRCRWPTSHSLPNLGRTQGRERRVGRLYVHGVSRVRDYWSIGRSSLRVVQLIA